jgi:RNA polymerase sigma factor (TIGR02999 family)
METRPGLTEFVLFLERAAGGDELAPAGLESALYEELRSIARKLLRSERKNHTLQPTAIVNEACLRLLRGASVSVNGRSHLLALAARQMRRVIVDYERARRKRIDGRMVRTTLADIGARGERSEFDTLDLDEALSKLAALSERQARVIELRYFGGLLVEEAARTLGVSERTIKNDTRVALAWLRRELHGS